MLLTKARCRFPKVLRTDPTSIYIDWQQIVILDDVYQRYIDILLSVKMMKIMTRKQLFHRQMLSHNNDNKDRKVSSYISMIQFDLSGIDCRIIASITKKSVMEINLELVNELKGYINQTETCNNDISPEIGNLQNILIFVVT